MNSNPLAPVAPPLQEDMVQILRGKMPASFRQLVESNKQAMAIADAKLRTHKE